MCKIALPRTPQLSHISLFTDLKTLTSTVVLKSIILPGRQRSPNTSRLLAFTPLWLSILSCKRNTAEININSCFQINCLYFKSHSYKQETSFAEKNSRSFWEQAYSHSSHELDEKISIYAKLTYRHRDVLIFSSNWHSTTESFYVNRMLNLVHFTSQIPWKIMKAEFSSKEYCPISNSCPQTP